jgi:hypothetical protein
MAASYHVYAYDITALCNIMHVFVKQELVYRVTMFMEDHSAKYFNETPGKKV